MWFLKKYLCWLLEIIFLMFWSCLVSLLLYHLSFWRLYYLIFPPFFFLSLLWCLCFVTTSGCIILFIQNPKHYLKIFLVTVYFFTTTSYNLPKNITLYFYEIKKRKVLACCMSCNLLHSWGKNTYLGLPTHPFIFLKII